MLPTHRGEEVADPSEHRGPAGQHLGVAAEPQRAVGQAGLGVGRAVVDPAGRVRSGHHRQVGGRGRTVDHAGRSGSEHEVVGHGPRVAHHPLLDHQRRLGRVDEVGRTAGEVVEGRDPLGGEELGHAGIVPTESLRGPSTTARTIDGVHGSVPPSRVAPAPPSLRDVGQRVDARILGVLDVELARWEAVDPDLAEPLGSLRDLIAAGGKRLRPAFCHWAFVGAGGDPADARVVDAGAALELLHTFALVHDDVMDGSDQRRGLPSVHKHFIDRHVGLGWQGDARRSGEGAAILVGDFAFVYADQILGEIPPAARAVFDELRLELCVGQYLDLVGTASGSRDAAQATRIERYKSGKYTVERPLHLGAALAGADATVHDALSAVGLPLGEAFQLRDDLLGVFGDSSVTGKPVGDDLREGKLTPLIAAAAARGSVADQAGLARVGAPDLSADDIVTIQQILIDSGAVAEVEDRITDRVAEALGALDRAPIGAEARDALADLTRFAAWRDR